MLELPIANFQDESSVDTEARRIPLGLLTFIKTSKAVFTDSTQDIVDCLDGDVAEHTRLITN